MSVQSRCRLERDMYKVRTGVICSYGINTCTPIPQGHWSTGGMYPETLDNPDTSFSDHIMICHDSHNCWATRWKESLITHGPADVGRCWRFFWNSWAN